ncbi:MAG TPA: benzoate-CoA ligase family protein [Vicinamibacteria bacterium]|nr:benzoate-CoA ligase family protein [Vicinamibacteria bacterium]
MTAAPMEFPERFNMAWYFLDRNVEEGRGQKRCLLWRDQAFTYREVQARANRLGNALVSLGVRLEDRVLVVLPDSPEFAFTWFGAAKIGAVIAMVNPLLPAEDYLHYFEYTRARVAVVDAATAEKLEPLRDRFRHLTHRVVVGGPGKDLSFDEVCLRASDRLANADTHRDDPAIWLFTSGSTGTPKAAVHLQQDLPWNTERYAKQVLGIRQDDLTASVPKLFFGYATGTNLLFPFAVGAAAVLLSERSEPGTLFDVIERYRPTILTSVPTMIGAMLGHLELGGAAGRPWPRKPDLSSLRLVLSAGEALPPELYRRWMDTFGVEILDGIGSAEMFHIYISNYPGEVVPGSLGRLVPGYEARVVGPDGSDRPAGEAGTLWVKGESAAVLYWQAHEKSKEVLRGDWVVTGDHVRRDERGCFWYEGRTDDMLKVGGVFVSPYEVENCLLQHPVVAECAVIGYKDADGLIKPKAYVVPRDRSGDDSLARELQEFVKARLAPFKYPRAVEFASSLPKNDRGKIDRRRLASS